MNKKKVHRALRHTQLITADFRHWKHINQRNLQKIAA